MSYVCSRKTQGKVVWMSRQVTPFLRSMGRALSAQQRHASTFRSLPPRLRRWPVLKTPDRIRKGRRRDLGNSSGQWWLRWPVTRSVEGMPKAPSSPLTLNRHGPSEIGWPDTLGKGRQKGCLIRGLVYVQQFQVGRSRGPLSTSRKRFQDRQALQGGGRCSLTRGRVQRELQRDE